MNCGGVPIEVVRKFKEEQHLESLRYPGPEGPGVRSDGQESITPFGTQEQNTNKGHERLVRIASAFICETPLQ